MVRLTVMLKSSARGAPDLVEAFRFLMVSTRLDPGCLGCSVWAEPDSTVHYLEEWKTEADIRRRVQSERFTSVLSILESVHDPPHVQFDFVSTTRGLDYVEEVRRPSVVVSGLRAGRDGRDETRQVPRSSCGSFRSGCATSRTGSRRRACASSSCSKAVTAPARAGPSAP